MKKVSLLVFSAVLAAVVAGCTKENASEIKGFTGIEVEVGENFGSRLYILNEGAFPGASTLDLLDFNSKKYYADLFGQANPQVVQGLGNTANDMAVVDGHLWVLLNASNQIAILRIPDGKLIRTLAVDSPRRIALEGKYAYVSSYGAAVYGGDVTLGKVYRIHTENLETASIEVGYQPEGLAVSGGKLYVANSGGYNLEHDNRISVVDLASFTLEKQMDAPLSNLNDLTAVGGKLWVSTYGESTWTPDADGNWIQSVSVPQSLLCVTPDGTAKVIEGVHADKMTRSGTYIFTIGNDAEMTGGYDTCLYRVDTMDGSFRKYSFSGTDLSHVGYAYGLLVNPTSGDIYICDASFTSGSKVHCFTRDLRHRWTVETGIGTGHLLLQ